MTDADPDVSLSERVVMGLSPPGIGRRHREADLRKLPDRPSPGEPTANVGDRQVFGPPHPVPLDTRQAPG